MKHKGSISKIAVNYFILFDPFNTLNNVHDQCKMSRMQKYLCDISACQSLERLFQRVLRQHKYVVSAKYATVPLLCDSEPR